jgi:hypothetical protein
MAPIPAVSAGDQRGRGASANRAMLSPSIISTATTTTANNILSMQTKTFNTATSAGTAPKCRRTAIATFSFGRPLRVES